MSQIIRVLILILTVMLLGACSDLLSVEDKKSYGGWVAEGRFHIFTGHLIKGKKTSPGGQITEGTFDKETGAFIEGKGTLPDGI